MATTTPRPHTVRYPLWVIDLAVQLSVEGKRAPDIRRELRRRTGWAPDVTTIRQWVGSSS